MARQVEKPKFEMTRRQLSRWEQQRRRQRLILIGGILVIIAVFGIVGAGVYQQWYLGEYKMLREIVIEVNDTKFDMNYYIKMLKYYRTMVPSEQMFGITDEVAKAIQEGELIRQGAARLGFSFSDAEVDERLASRSLPLSQEYRDAVRTQMLVEKLREEYFDKQIPASTEQRHILAMFLESEQKANEVRARLEAGEDFGELAGELSLDETTKQNKGDLDWHPKGILTLRFGLSLVEEYAFGAEAGALSQPIFDENKTKPVGYWLIKVLERDESKVTATTQVMLLGSEQEAIEVRSRLEAGEDFAELASKLSQHIESKESGGNFEAWADKVSPAFEEFAFNSELNVLSQPIRDEKQITKGGYWLVKVAEVDSNRHVTDEDRNLLKNDALSKWIDGLFNDPENKLANHLDMDKKLFAISHALKD